MMQQEDDMITHVLKDGTVIHDISDHIVKEDDAREAYAVMDSISQKGEKNGHHI